MERKEIHTIEGSWISQSPMKECRDGAMDAGRDREPFPWKSAVVRRDIRGLKGVETLEGMVLPRMGVLEPELVSEPGCRAAKVV